MLNTAIGLLRKDRLLKYIIGGGTWILLIGLLGSVAYNGLWDDDNKWTNLQFGRQRQTHSYAIATLVMGLFAFLAILAALLLSIFMPSLQLVQLILWGSGYLLTLITISVQGAGLDYTTYAVGLVQDEYNYLEQYDEFSKYVSDYSAPNFYLDRFDLSIINAIRLVGNAPAFNPAWFAVYPKAFYVTYREKVDDVVAYATKAVASCAFDWDTLALDNATFTGDPCSFKIDDADAEKCIGGWSGEAFKDYWCYLWTISEEDRKFAEDGATTADLQKREQTRIRDELVIDSLAAYYRHNTYLIGINVAAMIASAVTVGLDFWISKGDAPEDKAASGKGAELDDVGEAKPGEGDAP